MVRGSSSLSRPWIENSTFSMRGKRCTCSVHACTLYAVPTELLRLSRFPLKENCAYLNWWINKCCIHSVILPHNPMALSLQFTSSTVMFGVLEHTKQRPVLFVSFLDLLSTKQSVHQNYFFNNNWEKTVFFLFCFFHLKCSWLNLFDFDICVILNRFKHFLERCFTFSALIILLCQICELVSKLGQIRIQLRRGS